MGLSENILQTHKCFLLAAEKVKKDGRAIAGISVCVKTNFVNMLNEYVNNVPLVYSLEWTRNC